MKKAKRLLFVLLSIFLLSGCAKYRTNMTINKDKSMNLEVDILFSNQITDYIPKDFSEENFKKIGFNINTEKEEEYVGYRLTKSFKSIDDLSSETTQKASLDDLMKKGNAVLFKRTKGLFKDTYSASIEFKIDEEAIKSINALSNHNIENEESNISDNKEGTLVKSDDKTIETVESSENDDLRFTGNAEKLAEELEYKFTINLPYKAESSNADENNNNDKSLVWTLGNDVTSTVVEFTFSILNITSIILICGIVILVIVAIVVVLLVLKKKNGSKDTLIHKDYDPSIASQINDTSNNLIDNSIVEGHEVVPQVQEPISEVQEETPQIQNTISEVQQPIPPSQDSIQTNVMPQNDINVNMNQNNNLM